VFGQFRFYVFQMLCLQLLFYKLSCCIISGMTILDVFYMLYKQFQLDDQNMFV